MTTTTVTRQIDARVDRVFDRVTNVVNFPETVPDIVRVELLSEATSGVGTRFRETRLMRGKETTTELEITEYEENRRARFVADAGGTIWDTVYTTVGRDGGTELTLVMEARAYKTLSKFVNPLIKGMVQKAIEKDMDAVKAYCEAG